MLEFAEKLIDINEENTEANKIVRDFREKEEEEREQQIEQDKKQNQQNLKLLGEDFNFTFPAPNVTLRQDEVIKTTAQYVAVNGEDFLIMLTERKRGDPKFDFLKPSNSKFNYFTRLVDSYVKIISFNEKDYRKLNDAVRDKRYFNQIYEKR